MPPKTMAEAIAENEAAERARPIVEPKKPRRIRNGGPAHACMSCGERFTAPRGSECPTCKVPLAPQRAKR